MLSVGNGPTVVTTTGGASSTEDVDSMTDSEDSDATLLWWAVAVWYAVSVTEVVRTLVTTGMDLQRESDF